MTWERYSSLHNIISAEEFEAAEAKAELEVQAVIGPRYKQITPETYGFEQLLECIANVMDATKEAANAGAGAGVQSVSNDGYSVTYETKTASQARDEMHKSIKSWLSGTGMVGAY